MTSFKHFAAMVLLSSPVFGQHTAMDQPDSRLYELRTYHAMPGKLDDLLARFRDHTTRLFETHGMTNIGYWVPVDNTDHILVYLLAYPDRAARDASWKGFSADEDWKKVAAAAAGKCREIPTLPSYGLRGTR